MSNFLYSNLTNSRLRREFMSRPRSFLKIFIPHIIKWISVLFDFDVSNNRFKRLR
jgi:hypothetical protein